MYKYKFKMSFKIYENAVYLPPHNIGIIISDFDKTTINKNLVWNKGLLHAYDINKKKTYEVMIYQVNKHSVLIKPIKEYYCYVFEHLFDFGVYCDGFSTEKIINIYSKNIN